MKVGSLVCSRHDLGYHGIVLEVGPKETRTDHGRRACRIQWVDGSETIEFIMSLEVISEGR
jgi:hypothetical protein